jgi:hypothetical protein
MYHLVVRHPFHGYNIGDKITDPGEIAKLMAEHEGRVIRVPAKDEPQAAPGPVESND